jgi:hypothetical protein
MSRKEKKYTFPTYRYLYFVFFLKVKQRWYILKFRVLFPEFKEIAEPLLYLYISSLIQEIFKEP